MATAPSPPAALVLSLLLLLLSSPTALGRAAFAESAATNVSTATVDLSGIRSLCSSTPHPESCFSALDLSIAGINININPSILSFVFHILQAAISEVAKLSILIPTTPSVGGIFEKSHGALQDCRELHDISLSALRRSASLVQQAASDPNKAADVRAYLSAALTNKRTCLDGLKGSSGPMLPALVRALGDAYKHVSNSLSIVSRPPKSSTTAGAGAGPAGSHSRKLLGLNHDDNDFPRWLSRTDRRVLEIDLGGGGGGSGGDDNDQEGLTLFVAKDGSGNYTRVSDAVAAAPSNSDVRTFIMVKAGVYQEYVDVPSNKPNLVLLGDGADVTIIRGSRSAADGWTSFRSATLGVSAQGFLARDIAFENVAGPSKGQATALRVNADLAAFYRVTVSGYQDTLYAHSFRQFYRECNVLGTVDFIYGNAAAVFQACTLSPRVPIKGQANVITAQGRDDPNEDTGFSIHRCSVVPSPELKANPGSAKTYLGRPWWPYSRTVVMESYLGGLVDPAGWLNWIGDQGLETLYYGEFENNGPGSGTDNRVNWGGYHLMEYDDAVQFTVSEFIKGDDWLDSTSFPYDDGV